MKTPDLLSKVDHRTISQRYHISLKFFGCLANKLSPDQFFCLEGNQVVPVRLIVFYFCQGRSKLTEAPFMAEEEIVSTLEQRLNDYPKEILSELAEHLVR